MSVNGTAYTGTPSLIASNLTTANPNCTGSPPVCTVSAPAVAGTDVFKVATYDATQSSVDPTTPAGDELSLATTSVTIVAGVANNTTTPLVLSGVVASVDLQFSPGSVQFGTASSVSVIVNVRDADSNIIMGSYADANGNPLTVALGDSDTTGATKLTPSSLSSSSTSVSLAYDGAQIPTVTISPTLSGGTFKGGADGADLGVDYPYPTLTSLSQNVWVTSAAASSFTQTLTGAAFTSDSTVGVSGTGVTVSNVSVTSSTSITATFNVAANTAIGNDSVTVTTPETGASGSLPLAIDNGVIVTSNADTMPGSPLGTGTGVSGDLRYALQNTPASDAIVFGCGTPCTIALAGPLPPIEQNLVIAGDGAAQTMIDGASLYRPFFIDTGTVTIQDLQIQNGAALGGAGEAGGGGGLGAGGGIFINQATANVTVSNTIFKNCVAVGGAGGQGDVSDTPPYVDSNPDGGGGGGLGAPGGSQTGEDSQLGSGGGGVLSAGATSTAEGFTGGGGGAGLGGGIGGEIRPGGAGGAAYGSNSAGSSGQAAPSNGAGGNGGAGGFGGGGGGGSESGVGVDQTTGNFTNEPPGIGGNGGFGGGGGAGGDESSGGTEGAPYNGGNGGNGGAGGGGGGGGARQLGSVTNDGTAGSGGALATLSGGSGNDLSGGGGAAAGPAIFVLAGTLTISQSSETGSAATGGAAATSQLSLASVTSSAGGADSTPVFSFQGTINGSMVAGPASSALAASERSRARPKAVLRTR